MFTLAPPNPPLHRGVKKEKLQGMVPRASSRKSPKEVGEIRLSKIILWGGGGGGGGMHLATLMHSNHVICIVGVSRG